MNLDEIFITTIWKSLGGPELRGRNGKVRGQAFWRPKADGLNVAIDTEKGLWFDHVTGEGGGKLGLVEVVRQCDQHDALTFLEEHCGLTPSQPPTAEESERRRKQQVQLSERKRQAALFCLALEPLLIELLSQLPPIETLDWDADDPARLALTHELVALRVAQRDGRQLVEVYSEWQRDYPELAEAVTHAGLWREFRWSARLWRWWNAQQQSRRVAA